MLKLSEIDFGYNDATSYRNNTKSREMFASVFVKDAKFDRIMQPDTYFLIGDKGTGKTAYAVFLENQVYKNTKARLVDIASTDYLIFMRLERMGLIRLSDYSRVWKIMLLMIMANEIKKEDICFFAPNRSAKFEELKKSIDDYYECAFIPEISCIFRYVLDNTITNDIGVDAGIKSSIFNISGKANVSDKTGILKEENIHGFQNNLLLLERKFFDAFNGLKLNRSIFIFIDNIDTKSDDFTYEEFVSCIRGLGQAIWDVNTSVFRKMSESKGFLKAVLSIRTDLFPLLSLHNQANKIRDNGILLDWRTTYEDYPKSQLFELCNRLLAYNNLSKLEINQYWEFYFPWHTGSTNANKRKFDDSFINCLRYSLSRPRDMISIMKAIQARAKKAVSTAEDFLSNATENEISRYYIDEARDWCFYRFSDDKFKSLLFFFQNLNGKSRFTYVVFEKAFTKYIKLVSERKMARIAEHEDKVKFLQLLFDLNMISYLDTDRKGSNFFRFCYREREMYNLTPEVKTHTTYVVHYALLKSLNLGCSSSSED